MPALKRRPKFRSSLRDETDLKDWKRLVSYFHLIVLVLTLGTMVHAAKPGFVQNPPALTIQARTATSFEDGSGDGVFLVSRDGPTTQPLTVHLRIGGSATNGVDYLTIGNEVQIPAGSSSVEVKVKPINDTEIEADEVVTIGIGDVAINTIFDKTLASVSIKDNDTVVQVETIDANGSEAGSHPMVFRISRNGNLRSQLIVDYAINNSAAFSTVNSSGTTKLGDGSVRTISSADATAGSDFAALPGSVTFQLGETAKLISVVPNDDSLVEGRENVTINLLRGPLYTIGIRTASGFIEDNDEPLPVVQVAASARGSEAGLRPVVFRFERTGNVANTLTVAYAVNRSPSLTTITDGSSNTIIIGESVTPATSGVDFNTPSGSVTFPAGQSSVTLNITPIDDTNIETAESVLVTLLSSPSYTIGASRSATGFIDDNDQPAAAPPPTVSISVVQDTVDEDGSSNGSINVSRTGPTAQPLTVSYSINDPLNNVANPATNGVDFQSLSGQIVIPSGTNTATITVRAIDDNVQEPEERVVIALKSPTDGTYTIQPGSSPATLKIKNHH